MFTRVLKGHIALDSQVFPPNTPGCLLDTLARQYLWKAGKNYQHGIHVIWKLLTLHAKQISELFLSSLLFSYMRLS